MEWTSIIVAGIAFLGTFGGSVAGIRASNRMVEYRLDQLEKKVDLHNKVIDRTGCLEIKVEEMEKRLDEKFNLLRD